MPQKIIGLLGVLTALFPGEMIDFYEGVAIENADECTTKPRIRSGIRAEGGLITVACLTGGRAYGWMMNLTGIFGVVVLLFPQVYRKFVTALLYEEPEKVKWNDQFTDWIRVLGVVYVLLAVWEWKNRRDDDRRLSTDFTRRSYRNSEIGFAVPFSGSYRQLKR
ncbi:hypothetical protein [Natronococcus wangiae]|uniref:hypothetical protein n=1 Tax=Natronococcus wangiae TaxID=3068275 RepID=UPI00273D0762|nr:hypothetical protein [Natronococcus sp. AD5]